MTAEPPSGANRDTVTRLLIDASGGNVDALNRLFPHVYDQLREMARSRLRMERADHTLNTTALVHEAYLKLVDQTRVEWRNRSHFYAVASQAMRRILINHAKGRKAQKRGGGAPHLPLDAVGLEISAAQAEELVALDEALERLKGFNERGADVVVYRFFGGLTYEEIGEVLGTSTATIRRSWNAARIWLRRELREAIPGWAGSTLAMGGDAAL